MKHGSPDGRRSAPADLPILVNHARDADPQLAAVENYHPPDTTLTVNVRWGNELHRILPGRLSRPVAAVQEARLVASCIDPVLVRHLGYGLADVVELILRRVDHVATTLAPVWINGQTPNPGDVPSITSEEINATAELRDITTQVAAHTNPERALRALRSHSSPRNKLNGMPPSRYQTASFGTALAIRFGTNNYRTVPAALLMETIPAVVSDLASKAHLYDKAATERWNTTVFETVDRALRGSGHHANQLQDSDNRNRPVGFVVPYSPRQVLLVAFTASLTSDNLQQAVDSQQTVLSTDQTSTKLQKQFHLPPDTEIELLQIAACPETPPKHNSRSVPPMTLQDLLRICKSTSRNQVDLWHYVRSRRTEPNRLFACDEIDAWKWWTRNNKSFHANGTDTNGMSTNPNLADTEWVRAADMSSTEQALLALNLPGVADWPIVDDTGPGVHMVDYDNSEMARVLRWQIPTGFRISRNELLNDLTVGIASKLEGMKDVYERLFNQAGVASLMVTFRYDPDSTTPLTTPANNTHGTLNVGELHRWMRQVGHDGRLLKSISNRWRFLVWHSGSVARNAPGLRRCAPRGLALR